MSFRNTLSRIATGGAVVLLAAGAAVPVFAQSNSSASPDAMRPPIDQNHATPATTGGAMRHHTTRHHRARKHHAMKPGASANAGSPSATETTGQHNGVSPTGAGDKSMKTGG